MKTLVNAFKILHAIEYRDRAVPAEKAAAADALGIDPEEWCEIMQDLSDEGYISGDLIVKNDESGIPRALCGRMRITLRGARYLEENSIMQALATIAES